MDPYTDTFNRLLAVEVPKIIAITGLMTIFLCMGVVYVYFRVQSRRARLADRKETIEGQVQLGLVNLAAGISEQNRTFIAAIEAIRMQLAHEGELTRHTLTALTEAYKSHAANEEERLKMQRQVSERYADAIDANTEALHAHSKTVSQIEQALNETANAATLSNRRINERLDAQAQSLADMISSINKLPGEVGLAVKEKLEPALADFAETKTIILTQLKDSERRMIAALEEIRRTMEKDKQPIVPVPGLVPDAV